MLLQPLEDDQPPCELCINACKFTNQEHQRIYIDFASPILLPMSQPYFSPFHPTISICSNSAIMNSKNNSLLMLLMKQHGSHGAEEKTSQFFTVIDILRKIFLEI